MADNIEKLTANERLDFEDDLSWDLITLRIKIYDFSKEPINSRATSLKNAYLTFKNKSETIKERYGIEFPALQKQYEKMLPEIKKCFGIEEE
jgi:hypothetical protein